MMRRLRRHMWKARTEAMIPSVGSDLASMQGRPLNAVPSRSILSKYIVALRSRRNACLYTSRHSSKGEEISASLILLIPESWSESFGCPDCKEGAPRAPLARDRHVVAYVKCLLVTFNRRRAEQCSTESACRPWSSPWDQWQLEVHCT